MHSPMARLHVRGRIRKVCEQLLTRLAAREEPSNILPFTRPQPARRSYEAMVDKPQALGSEPGPVKPQRLVATLAEWFGRDDFRGCAFINSVGELGSTVPEVMEIAQRHKHEMTALLATLLPPGAQRARDAQAVTLVVEGAIVRVQMGEPVKAVLGSVERLLAGLAA